MMMTMIHSEKIIKKQNSNQMKKSSLFKETRKIKWIIRCLQKIRQKKKDKKKKIGKEYTYIRIESTRTKKKKYLINGGLFSIFFSIKFPAYLSILKVNKCVLIGIRKTKCKQHNRQTQGNSERLLWQLHKN